MFRIFAVLLLGVLPLFTLDATYGTTSYGRIQTSFQKDKTNICFKAPGASTKYRLGNECDTWIELALFQDLKLDNGVVIHTQVRPTISSPNNKALEYFRTEELYSELFNLIDDNSVSFWVGRRYYKRFDSHMSDYFYFNMSGDGFGINNYDFKDFKLSYSFIFDGLDPLTIDGKKEVYYYSHDLRFEKNFQRGVGTLFLNYMYFDDKDFGSGKKINGEDGFAVGFLYEDKLITKELFGMDGSNMTGVFYGQGAARGAGAYSPYQQDSIADDLINSSGDIKNSKTWRFINYNAFENDSWGVMSNIVYEHKDDLSFKNVKQNWYSAGVRPYYFISTNFRVVAEYGYDFIQDEINAKNYALSKITTAFEMGLKKGIWSRPVVRIFYTYASWNDNSKGLIGSDYYADKTAGDNAGIQLEFWW
jgi:maltoporin